MELFYMKESLLLEECDDIIESAKSDIELFLEDGEEPKQGIFNKLVAAIKRLIDKIRSIFSGSSKKEEKVKQLTNQVGNNGDKMMHVVDMDKVQAEYDKADAAIHNGQEPGEVISGFKKFLIKVGIPAATLGVAAAAGVAGHKVYKEVKANKAHDDFKKSQELLVKTDKKMSKEMSFLDNKLKTTATFDKSSAKNIVKGAKGQTILHGKDDKELTAEVQGTLELGNVMIKTQNYSSDLIISELTTIVHNGGTAEDVRKYKSELSAKNDKYMNADAVSQLEQRKQNFHDGHRKKNLEEMDNKSRKSMAEYNKSIEDRIEREKKQAQEIKDNQKKLKKNQKELSKKALNYGKENAPKKKGFIGKLFSKESTLDEVLNERTEDILKELLDD